MLIALICVIFCIVLSFWDRPDVVTTGVTVAAVKTVDCLVAVVAAALLEPDIEDWTGIILRPGAFDKSLILMPLN